MGNYSEFGCSHCTYGGNNFRGPQKTNNLSRGGTLNQKQNITDKKNIIKNENIQRGNSNNSSQYLMSEYNPQYQDKNAILRQSSNPKLLDSARDRFSNQNFERTQLFEQKRLQKAEFQRKFDRACQFYDAENKASEQLIYKLMVCALGIFLILICCF